MGHADIARANISTRLRQLRSRLGWTQAQLAAELAVHRSTISRWERGCNQPNHTCAGRVLSLERAIRQQDSERSPEKSAGVLELVPISLKQACDYITSHHRHHRPPIGAKFALGVGYHGKLAGVATVGRPVSRHLDDGATLEVTRVATDGTRNACSMLMGAAIRAARAIGYRRVISYTLESEPGSSMRAAGLRLDKVCAGGGSWSRPSRPTVDRHPLAYKKRWVWERTAATEGVSA